MNRIVYILLALLALTGFASQAQVPDFFCVDVIDAENVGFHWQAPDPVNPNETYTIHYLTDDSGAFEDFHTISDISDSPELQNIAILVDEPDPTVASVTFLFELYENGFPTGIFSDTISTIHLDVDVIMTSSVADLSWNHPSDNIPGGSKYNLYRQILGEPIELIEDFPVNVSSHMDELFGLCEVIEGEKFEVTYYVELVTPLCSMRSQRVTEEFVDKKGPSPVQTETILINENQDLEVWWVPSEAPDIDFYQIQNHDFVQQLPDVPHADIVGSDPVWTAVVDNDDYYERTVIGRDSCDNDQANTGLHQTMFLELFYPPCNDVVELKWNAYVGWSEDVQEYQIMMDNGTTGTHEYYLTIYPQTGSYNSISGNVEFQEFIEIVPNTEYSFYIEAISNGDQRNSTSNRASFKAEYPEVAAFNYISNVTTLSEEAIEIEVLVDTSAVQTRYDLYRRYAGRPFEFVKSAQLPVLQPGQVHEMFLQFIDDDVDANLTIYEYEVRAFDGCGAELDSAIFKSNISENMVLVPTTSAEGLVNVLNWNLYYGWDLEEGVKEYQIYRKLGSELDFTFLASRGPAVDFYEDDVEQFMLKEGQFCYKVVAIEHENSYGKPANSHSSIACATQEPLMWIPNTIVINGVNDEFKPVAGFIDFESYEMEIRNKGGAQLFYTDDVNMGWTGTFDGRPVRDDYYMYIIKYQDGAGQHYVEQGVLYVLRAEKQ